MPKCVFGYRLPDKQKETITATGIRSDSNPLPTPFLLPVLRHLTQQLPWPHQVTIKLSSQQKGELRWQTLAPSCGQQTLTLARRKADHVDSLLLVCSHQQLHLPPLSCSALTRRLSFHETLLTTQHWEGKPAPILHCCFAFSNKYCGIQQQFKSLNCWSTQLVKETAEGSKASNYHSHSVLKHC